MTKFEFELLVDTFLTNSLTAFLVDVPGAVVSLRKYLVTECNTEFLDFYSWVKNKQL